MEFQYYIVYLIVNIVCFLFALTILMRVTSDIGSNMENRMFRMMLILYMAFLVCEVIWVLGEGDFLPIPPATASAIKLAGTAFIPVKVYFWFQYAEMNFENPLAFTKKFRIITFIPAGIMLLIYLSNPMTGLIATINPDGSQINGPLVALTGVIDNIYGIAIIVHAIILAIRNKNRSKRRIYMVHCMFIIICTIGGMADAVISGTPIMPLAILLSFHVLFINLQESKIFNDAVTGLNNRRMADNYLREAIDDVSVKEPLCLLMMDIDGFKSVNDRFGHMEGDRALKITSECMKQMVIKWNGFLSRWGGDEFVIVIGTGDENRIEAFIKELREKLESAASENSLPYALTLSIGRAVCNDKDMDPVELIDMADNALYKDKAAKDLESGEWVRL